MRLTLVEQMGEHALDALEVGNPAAGLLQPLGGDAPDAAAVGSVFEFKQELDLLEREAEVLRTLDKVNAMDVTATGLYTSVTMRSMAGRAR